MSLEPIEIQPIIEAAQHGGVVLRNYFGQVLETTQKSTLADVRTKADLESEEIITIILTKAFPNFNIFGEEQGEIARGSDYTFVIDPLDGTNNFVLGIPYFAVSIGLFHNDTIIAGVIHVPLLDQTYSAQKGRGTFLNGRPIYVSSTTDIRNATLVHTCNYETPLPRIKGMFNAMFDLDVKRILTTWSSTVDFCLLAAGKVDGMINDGTELYDFAAGKLIAQEAGARITDYQNKPLVNDRERFFLLSNNTDEIHSHLLTITHPFIHAA